MYRIQDNEVDFILDDLKRQGIQTEDLLFNLLDHICCIIEFEKPENEDFFSFYKRVLPRFFKKEIKEIQQETDDLLTFKHFYAMKKTLNITGISSAVLTITGAIFKIMHWPGASIAIQLGGILFALVFLPLMIVLKFRDEAKTIDKIVLSFGFLIAMFAFTGVLFKLMHWPFANILMIGGSAAFIFVYVPLYFITRVRRPELRFNTIINSVLMMACGGLMFALMNLGFSKNYENLLDDSRATFSSNMTSLTNDGELDANSKNAIAALDDFLNDFAKTKEYHAEKLAAIVTDYNKKLEEGAKPLKALTLDVNNIRYIEVIDDVHSMQVQVLANGKK